MASSSDAGNGQGASHQANIPQLPESDPDSDIPTLKLGEKMKFDHLGPVIINADGTTRSIENWNELTEKEKEVTWRRISKRNAQRREALHKKMQEEGVGEDSNEPAGEESARGDL
eukprot:CAMPEP_0113562272 /NCGR_PEP_ID=MMETSP0015_2-20120614/20435_1 /TAXON_ID=2838 /ORGANISM="Odontella" /LENGTH=114 /DNA_ID=CAMNT_0000464151 /DNA_START=126 /DNA_END=470 /DNA_ORIENTATION=- /assembly_acc=CAM_ASM_000160